MSIRDDYTAPCPKDDCCGTVWMDTDNGYGKCDTCKCDDWSEDDWDGMMARGEPFYDPDPRETAGDIEYHRRKEEGEL